MCINLTEILNQLFFQDFDSTQGLNDFTMKTCFTTNCVNFNIFYAYYYLKICIYCTNNSP